VTCSTGNHALAFVYACSTSAAASQARSTIYLPTTASPAKVTPYPSCSLTLVQQLPAARTIAVEGSMPLCTNQRTLIPCMRSRYILHTVAVSVRHAPAYICTLRAHCCCCCCCCHLPGGQAQGARWQCGAVGRGLCGC
jgi:hypothetical protein